MRTLTIRGLRLRIHPALVMMLGMSAMCGEAARAFLVCACLLAHELAHVLCARFLRVRVVELELMPFGGAARLENVWALRPGQMALVALAGPLTNALLFFAALYLGKRGWIAPRAALGLMRDNAALCLFNLLPALPLDGGRLVWGLAGCRLGAERAARYGVWSGRALAALLLASVCAGALGLGQVSLTPALCAVFLLAAGPREKLSAGSAALMSLLERRAELSDEGALPVRWLAATSDARVSGVVARFRPRALHRVAVYDPQMRLCGVLEEETLLGAALRDANALLGPLVQ